MFIGRTQELKQLEEAYRMEQSNAFVLYGRSGIGKTELARLFAADKPFVFYAAKELSEQEQCFSMAEERNLSAGETVPPSFYETMRLAAEKERTKAGEKVLLILDEFHLMVKTGHGFLESFIRMLNEEDSRYLFILISSSVNWVENSMVADMTFGTRYLSGIIKVKEFSFVDMVNRFPNMPVEQTIYATAILGGIPGYLRFWKEGENLRENLMRLFLTPDAVLLSEAEHFLKSELRELGAYNAILAALASGKYKLNDIYARTGFSRAKISVYIKNLIELDVVEKIFSYDAAEHANVQKGLYRIRDSFLGFWYRYVFPNLSAILLGRGEEVYEQKILPTLDTYMRERFSDVCGEYLKLMNQYHRLQHSYVNWGSWYGKTGLIDLIAGDSAGNHLVAFCSFTENPVTKREYEKYKELLTLATLTPQECFVFSKAGFDAEFTEEAKRQKITLVSMEDL